MKLKKVPGYEDKVLDKEKLKKLKRLQTDLAIKKQKGGEEQDDK